MAVLNTFIGHRDFRKIPTDCPQCTPETSGAMISLVGYRAKWCLVCLRPIDEGDLDVAVLIASSGLEERETLVHGQCYRARDTSRRDDIERTVRRPHASATDDLEIVHVGPRAYTGWGDERAGRVDESPIDRASERRPTRRRNNKARSRRGPRSGRRYDR